MPTRPVFDDAHWHWNGNYPSELLPEDEEADPPPVVHIAFFLAWAIARGLACAEHADRAVLEVRRLEERNVTPWGYLTDRVGCRLMDGDFGEEGLAFATAYYGKPPAARYYFTDFCMVFAEAETAYHVADTWANFDRLAPLLDEALEYWRAEGSMAGWEDEAVGWWEEHTSADEADESE